MRKNLNTGFYYQPFLLIFIGLIVPFFSNGASLKRGLCWNEGKVKLNEHHVNLLSPGVSWIYNWGSLPGNPAVYSEDFCFIPMAWNGNFDADKISGWLKEHPETKYILGFNEPNFSDQANMTPAQAVEVWPKLEEIAEEYDVKLVAPALNFSRSSVGGKIWGVYEWYDEFFRLYPEAKVDCLALHCYMNWYTATVWFALEYFYKDLYIPTNENYGKYPNLVKFLDNYKKENGDFPHMMLTEFCGWEYDYFPDVYFQIDQMTQKVQKLEQSKMVEGYAWFIGNSDGGATTFPYMSVFQTNSANSLLSELGNVYVNMSTFDESHYYHSGETILAKDYINASTDDQQIKIRNNSEHSSSIPLQIAIPGKGSCEYLIEASSDGEYTFKLHGKNNEGTTLYLYSENKKIGETEIGKSNGQWMDFTVKIELSAGRQTIKIFNAGSSIITLNSLMFEMDRSGVEEIVSTEDNVIEVFNLQGISMGKVELEKLRKGIYFLRLKDGSVKKILK